MRDFRRGGPSRGRGRRDDRGEDRQMHKATCDDCGNKCEVPFKPSSDKPVYCSDCFRGENTPKRDRNSGGDRNSRGDRNRNYRDDRNSRGDDRGRPTMHKVTCDDCGERCEVPFRPSGDKPVYCRDCFSGESSAPKKRQHADKPYQSNDQSGEKQEEIVAKLDKILFLLQRKSAVKEITVMKPKKEKAPSKGAVLTKMVKTVVKKAAVKKVVKKVTKKATPKKAVKKVATKKTTKKATKKK